MSLVLDRRRRDRSREGHAARSVALRPLPLRPSGRPVRIPEPREHAISSTPEPSFGALRRRCEHVEGSLTSGLTTHRRPRSRALVMCRSGRALRLSGALAPDGTHEIMGQGHERHRAGDSGSGAGSYPRDSRTPVIGSRSGNLCGWAAAVQVVRRRASESLRWITCCSTPDLAMASRSLGDRYGLRSVEGGRHPDWGTANWIVPVGDAYLELVGVVDERVAERSPFGRWVAGASPRRSADRLGHAHQIARRCGNTARSPGHRRVTCCAGRAAPDVEACRSRARRSRAHPSLLHRVGGRNAASE